MRFFSGPLERRLFFSYFGAFALVIVIFAIAVRLSFESILQQQISARLEALARAGTAAVELTPGGFRFSPRTLGGFNVRPGSEGIEWFDPARRSVASRGLFAQRSLPPVVGRAEVLTNAGTLDTVTVALTDDRGNVHGYVRAGETIEQLQAGTRALDLGLLIASLLAIVAASIGGAILARGTRTTRAELRAITAVHGRRVTRTAHAACGANDNRHSSIARSTRPARGNVSPHQPDRIGRGANAKGHR